jgi:hypothetical protein
MPELFSPLGADLSVLLIEVQKWRSLEFALEKAPMFRAF